MPQSLRSLAAWLAARVPAILVLGLIGGLAVWGARNDWKVPRLGRAVDDLEEEGKVEKVKVIPVSESAPGNASSSPATRQARIEFPSTDVVRATGIEVVTVQTRDMTQAVTANGMLDYEPYRYAQLAARGPGTVWWVEKELGEPVKKGEVLALIDSGDVGRAKADFLQSLAQVDVKTAALVRLQSATGAVSGGNLREAQAALREARLRLFNDHQRLLNLNLPFNMEDVTKLSEDQQVKYLRLLGLPEKVRKAHDVETLTANLLPLTAPFDGQLVRHPHAAPGEVVATNQPLFAVGDTRELHIELEVTVEDAALLRVGQIVTFVPAEKTAETNAGKDNQAKRAKGKLSHISPEVNEKTRRVQVHAELENPDRRWRPNTYGTGQIQICKKAGVVAVPAGTIQSETQPEGRFYYVFVRLSETSFQVRPVKLGLADQGFVEVDGVQPGESVVTTCSHVLKSELLKERIGHDE